VLYNWIGGTRRDWRGQGRFRALTEESEAWAHSSASTGGGKDQNRFYDMRGTLDHLEFERHQMRGAPDATTASRRSISKSS
jgi:hypothetical protein